MKYLPHGWSSSSEHAMSAASIFARVSSASTTSITRPLSDPAGMDSNHVVSVRVVNSSPLPSWTHRIVGPIASSSITLKPRYDE